MVVQDTLTHGEINIFNKTLADPKKDSSITSTSYMRHNITVAMSLV